MEKHTKYVFAMLLVAAYSGNSSAAVSAEEAKQLGSQTYTPIGAEKAGNKEGTIPEYTGQPLKLNIDPKEPGYRPDPFASEKPLFSITAQNAAQYADKLDGMVEVFKKYPSFRMDVYPSHRTAYFPKYVLDNTLKNATNCKGLNNGLTLEGCYGGVLFPIPKTGLEVMWNHVTAFEMYSENTSTHTFIVPNGGKPLLTNASDGIQQWPNYDPSRTTPMKGTELYYKLRIDYSGPPRSAGEKLVLLDPFDLVNNGRRAYSYIPGQRRVKLAPDLAYDTPSPVTGGIGLMDTAKGGFFGAPDRYNFKLIGKKEKFISYNAFKTQDYKNCSVEKLLINNFPNPDCSRWELHRVWVVEGTLKPEYRHVHPRRMFFWDEDGYGTGVVEHYDAAKQLYRLSYNLAHPFGGEWGTNVSQTIVLNLQTGGYAAEGLVNRPGGQYVVPAPRPEYFSPEALAGEGIR